jgi:pyridoxamine 5'-phosphate oxidase
MQTRSAPGCSTGTPLDNLRASHAHIEAQLDAMERLSEHVARCGGDEHARGQAAMLMRDFEGFAADHLSGEEEGLFPLVRSAAEKQGRDDVALLIRQGELDHAVVRDLYSVLRKQLQQLADGKSGRLDIEWVARFAWNCRRHMVNETAFILPCAAGEARRRQREDLER